MRQKINDFVMRLVSYAKYKTGSTYTKVVIHRKEQLDDGSIAMYFSVTPQQSSDVTITEIQLYDTNNELLKTFTQDLTIRGVQDGALYRFNFRLEEV